jgi:MFS family permease
MNVMNSVNYEEDVKHSGLIQGTIYVLYGLGPLTGNVILVLFGVLSIEFKVDPSALLIAIPAFMFPFAFIQLFSGALSDVKGRFSVILFGLLIFGIGMFIGVISNSLILYLIANVLGGVGFGFVNPVLIALLTDITPSSRVPERLGFLGAVAGLGIGFGPFIAGQMALIGWRYLYILFVIITILGFIIMFALRGSIQKSNIKSSLNVFFQNISREIRRVAVILMILSAFLASSSYLASIIWTSRGFTGVIPPNLAGIVLAFAGIAAAITGFLIGAIIQKKGISIAIMLGLILLFIGIVILNIIGTITPSLLIFTLIGLIFEGAAGGIFIPSIMYYSQTLSKERRGALAGLATMGQFVGIALVPIMYEPLFNVGGIRTIYILLIFPSILLLIFLILLYNKSRSSQSSAR